MAISMKVLILAMMVGEADEAAGMLVEEGEWD